MSKFYAIHTKGLLNSVKEAAEVNIVYPYFLVSSFRSIHLAVCCSSFIAFFNHTFATGYSRLSIIKPGIMKSKEGPGMIINIRPSMTNIPPLTLTRIFFIIIDYHYFYECLITVLSLLVTANYRP